jgi:hypothetical protein
LKDLPSGCSIPNRIYYCDDRLGDATLAPISIPIVDLQANAFGHSPVAHEADQMGHVESLAQGAWRVKRQHHRIAGHRIGIQKVLYFLGA